MSYIQINIGGQDRGLKFNQGAHIMFTDLVDRDNIKASAGYALIYSGLWANCFVKRLEPDFTFEQVCDWCETLDEKTYMDVLECYKKTQSYQKDIPESADDDLKKNNEVTEPIVTEPPGS